MKKTLRRHMLVLSVVVTFTTATTATPVFAKDPCATFICMVGKLQGNNLTDSCTKPIEDYFSIIDYHHGHVDFTATPKDRLNFMKQCPGGDPSKMDAITSMFGAVV